MKSTFTTLYKKSLRILIPNYSKLEIFQIKNLYEKGVF